MPRTGHVGAHGLTVLALSCRGRWNGKEYNTDAAFHTQVFHRGLQWKVCFLLGLWYKLDADLGRSAASYYQSVVI
jgi:hypothetical protein